MLYEYRPRPGKDPVHETFSFGWRYMDELEDRIAVLNNNALSAEERSPDRAAERRKLIGLASYVVGAGVVYDAQQDEEQRWLVLTRDDLVYECVIDQSID